MSANLLARYGVLRRAKACYGVLRRAQRPQKRSQICNLVRCEFQRSQHLCAVRMQAVGVKR